MLKATYKHTGKMDGMVSVSTYKGCNKQCQAYSMVEGSICQHCYVDRALRYKNNLPKYIENYNILNNSDISINDIKGLRLDNYKFVRFEAFGDLGSPQCFINYCKICNYYSDTNFTLWTKNPHFIAKALETIEKPKNLIIIVSSLFVNVPYENKRGYDFIDKIFTVYDKDYIKDNDVRINCGAKNCLGCKLCYKKNKVKFVNEILK